jgi:hypothetical protein
MVNIRGKFNLGLSDELEAALANDGEIEVPLTFLGNKVGMVSVGANGKCTFEVTKVSKELRQFLEAGWSDSLALSPNIAIQKET